jgi:hypothetical protein
MNNDIQFTDTEMLDWLEKQNLNELINSIDFTWRFLKLREAIRIAMITKKNISN